MTWLLLSVVLASVYSSKLTSSLTVRQPSAPFSSLAELLEQDTYTWGFETGTAVETTLKNSPLKAYERFLEGARRFAESDPRVMSPDMNTHLEKLQEGRYAFFGELNTFSARLQTGDCSIVSIPENLMVTSSVFYLQKGSPYTRLFSREIGRIVDAGLMTHWRRKWYDMQRAVCEEPESRGGSASSHSQRISLAETQSAFVLAAVGVLLALLVLWIERRVSRAPRTPKR